MCKEGMRGESRKMQLFSQSLPDREIVQIAMHFITLRSHTHYYASAKIIFNIFRGVSRLCRIGMGHVKNTFNLTLEEEKQLLSKLNHTKNYKAVAMN